MRFFAILLLIINGCNHFNRSFYCDVELGSQDTKAIEPLLQQRYIYLGQGAQMVAFASEDGAYVLKLFKAHHHRPFKWSSLTRGKKEREASHHKWRVKFNDTCRRYNLAFAYLKEETGLVFLHFHQSLKPLPVTLVDKATKQVDLSTLPFILQKKAVLAPDYMRHNPTQGKLALKEFFTKRIEKGFSDPRQTLSKNYGFIGNTPIQIDAGKIERFDSNREVELKKIHAHIEEWASRF